MNFEESGSNLDKMADEADFVIVVMVRGDLLAMHSNLAKTVENDALAVRVLQAAIQTMATAHN